MKKNIVALLLCTFTTITWSIDGAGKISGTLPAVRLSDHSIATLENALSNFITKLGDVRLLKDEDKKALMELTNGIPQQIAAAVNAIKKDSLVDPAALAAAIKAAIEGSILHAAGLEQTLKTFAENIRTIHITTEQLEAAAKVLKSVKVDIGLPQFRVPTLGEGIAAAGALTSIVSIPIAGYSWSNIPVLASSVIFLAASEDERQACVDVARECVYIVQEVASVACVSAEKRCPGPIQLMRKAFCGCKRRKKVTAKTETVSLPAATLEHDRPSDLVCSLATTTFPKLLLTPVSDTGEKLSAVPQIAAGALSTAMPGAAASAASAFGLGLAAGPQSIHQRAQVGVGAGVASLSSQSHMGGAEAESMPKAVQESKKLS